MASSCRASPAPDPLARWAWAVRRTVVGQGHEAPGEGYVMQKPGLVVIGVVIALAGALFTLQGLGVVTGSSMTGSSFWAVAGPVVALAGLATTWVGLRGRQR